MTGLRIISRMWLCGVAALTAAAFLACGGPPPIRGSSSLTGTSQRSASSTSIDLTTSVSSTTDTTIDNVPPTAADGGNCKQ